MKTTDRHPNYLKRLMASPEGHDHPIDQAVRERIDADAVEARIRDLQGTVRKHLDPKGEKAFMKLGDLHNDLSDRRAEASFNIGYEHGLAAGAARAHVVATSRKLQQIVRELSERITQAQLSPEEAAIVAYGVQGAVMLSKMHRLPQGRLALEAGAPQ